MVQVHVPIDNRTYGNRFTVSAIFCSFCSTAKVRVGPKLLRVPVGSIIYDVPKMHLTIVTNLISMT